MKSLRYYILVLFLMQMVSLQAEPVVIISSENDLSNLNKEEVIGLFMGRNFAFPNGQNAIPFDQVISSAQRNDFYQLLTNKTTVQINAYWARLVFSGRATPPRVLEDKATILATVRNNPNAIAYIDSEDVDSTVKVVYRFHK